MVLCERPGLRTEIDRIFSSLSHGIGTVFYGLIVLIPIAGYSKQTCSKTGTRQAEMQLPAGDEDNPAGPRSLPDDPRSCLR